ncbi:S1 RNA-binding domain-containing protein [Yinghuangia seranimata]|uniref:S1 RNA-binding domain-containing protein n=1 Tax=Yinghuangia seranimata TaxID=408067 RepID=UPI00248D2752|nr:S1 RNA-binding domain-containing protein [Yinghuangia seranimata]MDI2124751.1 S1 RNA-binding domain-containing protein [Yinghuangia seranimata]
MAGFALDAELTHLTVDNPMRQGFFSFSSLHGRGNHGLSGLFPYDLTGYHDGALVPLGTALGLVRAMVLREGTWCRLLGDGGFFVHVGTEHDVYVGATADPGQAVSRARALGLHVDEVARSPYDPSLDQVDEQRPADAEFWAEVTRLVDAHGGVLVEEQYIRNAYTWHRPTTPQDVDALRGRLRPRARLAVWPDPTEDADAVRDAIVRQNRLQLLVEQYAVGRFHHERIADLPTGAALKAEPGHRYALVPLEPADRDPLAAAVLPDADGVLRARWRADRTRADELRTYLASLRVGDTVTGVVSTGLHDIAVYVDLDDGLGRGVGWLRVPEMAWGQFNLADVAPVGREIRARIQSVDYSFEQVSLSVKALLPDPYHGFADTHQVGDTLPGYVTKLVPFGAFVRVAPGVEGLVPLAELADHEIAEPAEVVSVGDGVRVVVLDIGLDRRRITLSLRRATDD